MNITITGNLGAGKTTIRDELKKLGYDTLSGGDIFRKVAEEKGVSVVELNEMVKGDPTIDDEIDGMTTRLGKEVDNTVFDFRLGWHFVPDSFKVFLLIDPNVAATRVYEGNARNAENYSSVEECRAALKKRALIEQERFADLYGINYYDAKNYDLVIESSYATPEEITNEIIRCKELYESGDRTHRIELGIPGLYPTQNFSDFDTDKLQTCMNEEKETSSLCVSPTIPVAVKDGYSYILDKQEHILGGAAAGKKFASVRFDTSKAAQTAILPLTQTELKDFEDFSGFTYLSDTQTPKETFMMEFF